MSDEPKPAAERIMDLCEAIVSLGTVPADLDDAKAMGALLEEREAALARAEKAERERDEWRRRYEAATRAARPYET